MRPYPGRQAMHQKYKAQLPRVSEVGEVGHVYFLKVSHQLFFLLMSAVLKSLSSLLQGRVPHYATSLTLALRSVTFELEVRA